MLLTWFIFFLLSVARREVLWLDRLHSRIRGRRHPVTICLENTPQLCLRSRSHPAIAKTISTAKTTANICYFSSQPYIRFATVDFCQLNFDISARYSALTGKSRHLMVNFFLETKALTRIILAELVEKTPRDGVLMRSGQILSQFKLPHGFYSPLKPTPL